MTALDKIKSIRNKLDELEDKERRFVSKFQAEANNKKVLEQLAYEVGCLSMDCERECLLGLDGILAEGDEVIRQARKEQVRRAKALIDQCDTVRAKALACSAVAKEVIEEIQKTNTASEEDQGAGAEDEVRQEEKVQEKEDEDEDEEEDEEEDCQDEEQDDEQEQEAQDDEEDDSDDDEEDDDEGEDEEKHGDCTADPDPAEWLVDFSQQSTAKGVLLRANVTGALLDSIKVTRVSGGQFQPGKNPVSVRVQAFKPASQSDNYRAGTFGQLDRTFTFPAQVDSANVAFQVSRDSGDLNIFAPYHLRASPSSSPPTPTTLPSTPRSRSTRPRPATSPPPRKRQPRVKSRYPEVQALCAGDDRDDTYWGGEKAPAAFPFFAQQPGPHYTRRRCAPKQAASPFSALFGSPFLGW